jgi:4-amino-4-deoxy-L-arabinose transferase-like glycosyltransferase
MNQSPERDSRKRFHPWVLALIIFLVALAARLAYLYEYHVSGYWDIMALDPETHDLLARRIAGGLGLGERAYFRAPLYLYLLGAIYKLAGPGYLVPRIFQALLGSASAGLTYLIARRVLSPLAALAVGLLASTYWVSIYFDGELLVDGLALFFDLAVLYLLVQGNHQKSGSELSGGKAIILGVFIGLSVISRPNLLLFALAVILIKFFQVQKAGRKATVLILLGLFIPVLPVALHNIIVAKDFVPISSQGGINFYMGNNPDADGRIAVVPFPRRNMPSGFLARFKDDPWFKEDVWLSALYGAEQTLGREVKESEVSAYWYSQSLRWMSRHPLSWLKLMLKKLYFLIHRREVSNNRDLEYHLDQVPMLKALSIVHFGIISPLFILGLALSLSRIRKGTPPKRLYLSREGGWFWLDLFAITYGLSVILFFVNARYRLPLLPVAFILAGGAVSRLLSWVKEKRFASLGAGIAALLFLFWITNAELVRWNSRPLLAAMHHNLGLAFSRVSRFEDAVREFSTAVKIKDEFPEAHVALGNALAVTGKERRAINEYQIALLYDPDYAEAYYNMGLTYLRLKDLERARQYLIIAHSLAPEMFPLPGPKPQENPESK